MECVKRKGRHTLVDDDVWLHPSHEKGPTKEWDGGFVQESLPLAKDAALDERNACAASDLDVDPAVDLPVRGKALAQPATTQALAPQAPVESNCSQLFARIGLELAAVLVQEPRSMRASRPGKPLCRTSPPDADENPTDTTARGSLCLIL